MAQELPSDVLPILAERGFDQSIRGYDRVQVDKVLAHLEDELRAATADRDATAARSADLAAQLASAQAQIESLRRQLRVATETVTAENVDSRVAHMLETARLEATRIRTESQTAAEQVRNGAADQAARTRAAAHNDAERIVAQSTARLAEADETFRRRITEAEQHRASVEAGLAAGLAQTRAEEDRLTAEAEAERARLNTEAEAERARLDAEAEAERARLDAEAAAAREVADEDFEITLRARRTAETATLAEERAAAHAAAEEAVSAAHRQAAALVAEAADEVRRLKADRERTYADLRALHSRLGAVLDQAPGAPADGA